MTNHDKVIEDKVEEFEKEFTSDTNGKCVLRGVNDEMSTDFALVKIFLRQALKDIYQRGREDAFGEVSGWIDKGLDKLKPKE